MDLRKWYIRGLESPLPVSIPYPEIRISGAANALIIFKELMLMEIFKYIYIFSINLKLSSYLLFLFKDIGIFAFIELCFEPNILTSNFVFNFIVLYLGNVHTKRLNNVPVLFWRNFGENMYVIKLMLICSVATLFHCRFVKTSFVFT